MFVATSILLSTARHREAQNGHIRLSNGTCRILAPCGFLKAGNTQQPESQDAEYSAQQVIWAPQAPQGATEKQNSHECHPPAPARKMLPEENMTPVTWGWLVFTGVPPEELAEAPGEEPHTLPL
jgi:hypothetical protein